MSATTNTPDERPRPQYGEYATREEQLAHIQEPTPEQLTPEQAASATPAVAGHPSGPTPPFGSRTPVPVADPAALAATRNTFNRVATIAFLIYGLLEVILQVPSFLNMGILVNEQLTALAEGLGITVDPYTATAVTNFAGIGLSALWVLLWVLAALWSWSRIRRNKLAIWVPFLAGIVANLAQGIIISVLILSDPTLFQQIVSAIGGS